MADAAYGSLPFREQEEFFRRKVNLPTTAWTDVRLHEHDYAFVVAGANRDAIVADFRAAVEKAISGGSTLEDFRKDFDSIVAKHGWDYNGGRNWRSRVIYDTNLSTSYAAGRWEQLQEAPYWQYEHSDWVEHPREQHVAWDGLVLARDDPWWQTHFPPNGWGCQCTVHGLWPRDLQRLGKSGPDQAPAVKLVERTIGQRSPQGPQLVRVPQGIDPGFEYAPGSARLRTAIPPERPEPPVPGSAGGHGLPNLRPAEPLPTPRPVSPDVLLPKGLAPEAYVRGFLEPLGATLEQSAIVRDVIGERLVVGKELFQTAQGEWKVLKLGREQFLPLLAQALQDPDEVWVRLEWMYALQKAVVRRRYIARFAVEGQEVPALVVFERGDDGWAGVTAFQGAAQTADDWRVGLRLYARDQK
ncbi:PBECR2 nuclease fold domain-containing protein [Delftia sp. HK171]|uniref:PBECR2 nuclease fold domain-containing protein n=1 Tax=Delftia sp. HK171 TaxID=1920191 RepID=UPI001151157F|nr:PBECR2 nuclease fold domain-containing protein [Delftia sp. HK171]TQL73078.1 phage Mu protein F like protein [Delftia sp. HK171]